MYGAMLATGGSGKVPVISNTKGITLTFNNDGTLSGFGGCNNFNGAYTLSGIDHGLWKRDFHRAACNHHEVLR